MKTSVATTAGLSAPRSLACEPLRGPLSTPLPSLVCPEIEMRLGFDILFEHAHILLAIPEFLVFGWCDGMEGELVVATAHTLHTAIDEVRIEFSAHSLATCDDGSVLMEECHPLGLGATRRTLVSNEAQ